MRAPVFRVPVFVLVSVFVVAGSLFACAGRADAAVTVLGSERGEMCYKAALAGGAHSTDINVCTLALEQDQLSRTNRAATLVNRGVMELRLKDTIAALQDFDAALKIAPELGEAHVNRGAGLIMNGAFEEAVREISMGLDLGAEDPHEAYYNRGLAYEGMGDAYRAYQDYNAALALKPDWLPPREELKRFTVTRAGAQKSSP